MYELNVKTVSENVRLIKKAFEDAGVKLQLCYSFKTNMMQEATLTMELLGVMPEVVSQYEYEHVYFKKRPVVCNGVAMSYMELGRHVINGDLVNFNDRKSIEEVAYLYGNELQCKEVGVRIRFSENSRFGVLPEDLHKALYVIEQSEMKLKCLHCHVTATRELSKYRQKVRNMVDVIIKYGIKPEIIDLGGSMYGRMSPELRAQFEEVGQFGDYAMIISQELQALDYEPTVMLELGTALIANAVNVIGTVIRIDEYNRVVLDIDKYTIGQMISKDVSHTLIHSGGVSMSPRPAYKVYGASCIEDDLLIPHFEGDIAIGDKFVFYNCGAYSYCFEPEFIIPRQEVSIV